MQQNENSRICLTCTGWSINIVPEEKQAGYCIIEGEFIVEMSLICMVADGF